MENHNNETQKLAYLRELHSTNQCELAFYLSDTINGIVFNENVKAVRKITDTVGSLLQHIQNKLIRKSADRRGANDKLLTEIPVWLEDKDKKLEENVILKDLIQTEKVYSFYILKQQFKVVVNTPLVQCAHLPVVIYVNSVIQPIRFKTLHTIRDISVYEWYSSEDKENWVKVGQKYTYKTKESDVGRYLKYRCIPKSRNGCGPAYEIISENRVRTLPRLPKCPFEERHQHTRSKLTDKEFRFVSYNILSNRYAGTNAQFPYCPEEFLAIDYRKQLLFKEIAGYKADVICLQEVDIREFTHFFQSKFKKLHYEGVFHKKGNKSTEGLSCIYNAKKFKVIHSQQLVLCDEFKQNAIFKHIKESVYYGPDIEDILLKVATSLQVTVLQSKILKQKLIVGNTHLYYHPDANQVRIVQVAIITTFLNHLKEKFKQEAKEKVAVILCGDFNSMPTSEVYSFLIEGKLKDEHKKDLTIIKDAENFTHPFYFKSACGTPKYTNFTADFKGCLDYIFYEKQNIKFLRFVPFYDESVLAKNTALPSKVFPSDHIALIADLKFL